MWESMAGPNKDPFLLNSGEGEMVTFSQKGIMRRNYFLAFNLHTSIIKSSLTDELHTSLSAYYYCTLDVLSHRQLSPAKGGFI